MNSKLDLSYLHGSCHYMINRSEEERIRLVQRDVWINYPAAASVRATVRAISAMPKKSNAQCLLICGESGMGKSSIFEAIKHDAATAAGRLGIPSPMHSFEMGADPRLYGLGEVICELIGATTRQMRNGEVPKSLKMLLSALNLSGIMIDELHNLMLAGRNEQQKVLALLRSLNGPPLSWYVIGLGTMPAAHAIKSDPQMERRFQIFKMPSWHESEVLRSFLATYETLLPLKARSDLASQEKVKYLARVGLGSLATIVERVQRAAVYAILSGQEYIDIHCLEMAESIPTLEDN